MRIGGWVKARAAGARDLVVRGLVGQSVEQLISIMQASTAGTSSQLSVGLSATEAMRRYYRWQYAAASALADAVLMVPWHIQQREGDKWIENDEHPMGELLRRVNPFMTFEELLHWAVVECSFRGTTYWHVALNGINEPAEFWPLIGTVKPRVDKKMIVTKWVQEIYGARGEGTGGLKTNEFKPEEIVFLRTPKVGDLFGGFGAVMGAGAAIRLDEQIIESEWAAFKQGIFPFAVLKFGGNWTDPKERQRLIDEFNAKYAGAKQSGRTIGIPQTVDVDWQTGQKREMNYVASGDSVRDQVLGVMRVPEAILGLSKTLNKANVQGVEYIFAKWRLAPFLRMLQARLNQDVARRYYAQDNVRIVWDSPVPEDELFGIKRADMELSRFAITADEYRQERGRGPMDGGLGERPIAPYAVGPLGSEPPAGAAAAKPAGEQQLDVPPRIENSWTPAQRRELSWRFVEEKLALERRYQKAFASYFDRLGEQVVKAWDSSEDGQSGIDRIMLRLPSRVNRLLTSALMARDMARVAKPYNRQGIVLGGQFEKAALGAVAEDWMWDGTMDAVSKYAASYGVTHYLGVATRTRQAFVDTVSAGMAKHETWDELRSRIVREFGAMRESRAANIATTESTRLYNAGAQGFRVTYKVPGKVWVCTFVNSRESHIAADGQARLNDESFVVGADVMLFPGDGSLAEENCNCNCYSVGTFDVKEKEK